MSKGRLSTIWQNLKKASYIYRQKQVLIYVDKDGNKFFEKPADASKDLKASRWVEPADGDQWKVPVVSAEWNAWLRGRRQEPPSVEELEKNELNRLKVQMRAEALEQSREAEHRALDEAKPPAPGNKKTAFPTYPNFEYAPGEKLDKNAFDKKQR